MKASWNLRKVTFIHSWNAMKPLETWNILERHLTSLNSPPTFLRTFGNRRQLLLSSPEIPLNHMKCFETPWNSSKNILKLPWKLRTSTLNPTEILSELSSYSLKCLDTPLKQSWNTTCKLPGNSEGPSRTLLKFPETLKWISDIFVIPILSEEDTISMCRDVG